MVYFSPTSIALAAFAMGLVQGEYHPGLPAERDDVLLIIRCHSLAAPAAEHTASPSKGGVCSGNLKKSDVPLWIGAPKRQDAARDPNIDSTWWKEASAVSNALMGLKVRVDGGTGKGKWE